MEMNHDIVYYNLRTKEFFRVGKDKVRQGVVCGGFSNYYQDAKTTSRVQTIPENKLRNYLRKCIEITDIESNPKLFFYDGFGWRGKKSFFERVNDKLEDRFYKISHQFPEIGNPIDDYLEAIKFLQSAQRFKN
jgi:hypothetical protein